MSREEIKYMYLLMEWNSTKVHVIRMLSPSCWILLKPCMHTIKFSWKQKKKDKENVKNKKFKVYSLALKTLKLMNYEEEISSWVFKVQTKFLWLSCKKNKIGICTLHKRCYELYKQEAHRPERSPEYQTLYTDFS